MDLCWCNNRAQWDSLQPKHTYIRENLWLVWMEGKGGEVKESRVKFAKNKLIFELIYFTLLPIPPPQSK